jgi:beta-glucosidase
MTSFGSMLRTATAVAALMVLSTNSAAAFDWPWNDNAPKVPAPPPPAYTNPQLPFEQRVNDLISRMTLEEKASQLVNQARPIPRLGVPGYNWWSEALHGVARNGVATVFPQAIALGATFDPALIHEMGVAISTEARVKFNQMGGQAADHTIYQGLTFWSPNVNIFRDPRWGRGQETYGEDPFLTGEMGKAFVRGMQGDDPKYLRTIATPKHFAVHSGPESKRHGFDAVASKHDMMDTYLPQFRASVLDGQAGSVMCAYNRTNGQPACANDFLLTEVLRKAWGFKGYVVSDCGAIDDIALGHHFTKTLPEAAAVSMKHGVDNDCIDFSVVTRGREDYKAYADAMSQGLLPESVVDESLKRLFLARMKLGLFDPKETVAYAQVPESALDSDTHRQLALRTARESMVLLKNNGALPLKPKVRRIAVIGPLADQVTPLLGNYNGTPSQPVTALEGLKRRFPDAQIVFEPGTNFQRGSETIPGTLLSSEGKPGFKVEFFDNEGFTGTPVMSRIDSVVDYVRDRNGLGAAQLPEVTHFAARWTGTLTPAQTGDYAVGLDAPFGQLWLDGKKIVDLGAGDQTSKTVLLHLEAGHAYAIKIERGFQRRLSLRFVWAKLIPDAKARALAAVKKADVVVAVVGITPQLEGEEMVVDVPGFEGGDRTSLDMPKQEEDLLKAVRKVTRKPLVVVLNSGSPLAVNWAAKNADAIVESWYGGEEGGTAVADILSGAYNPSGRLPVTFYTSVKQLPAFEDYSMANRTYRYFKGKPLYPFGYGLSYTKYSYSGLKLSSQTVKAGDALGVDVAITNKGKVAGDEVAQLYLSFPKLPGTPLRALRGVQHVTLQPGETKTVHFDLTPRDLSSVTEAGEIKVQPGAYSLAVGGGQPGTTKAIAVTKFTIDGEQLLPE